MTTTRHWVGGIGIKSWTDTANWSETDGGTSGAAVPVTGDTVYILRGRSEIVQNVSQGAVSLAYLEIGFEGSVGAGGNPLTIGIGAGGELRISAVSDKLYISPTLPATALFQIFNIAGSVFVSGGSVQSETVIGQTGVVNFESSVTYAGTHNNIFCCGAKVNIAQSTSTNSPSLHVAAGDVICAQHNYSSRVDAGTLTLTGVASVSSGGTGLVVGAGGKYIHNSSGTIGSIDVRTGGIASSAKAVVPFTVSGGSLYVGGSMFEESPVAITYSSAIVKFGFAS